MERPRIAVQLPKPIPVLAMRAETAAAALDISLGSFLTLVKEGKMPRPIVVPGHRGLVLYDFEAVRQAWADLQSGADSSGSEWDE